jgi:tRNA pseudouridine38-40 synthase
MGMPAPNPLYKYKITLEYDGTGYRGWQTQKNARSVQGTLIEAAEKIFSNNIELQGAGRTDAGVHALAQVAHLAAARKINPQRLREELNDLLPASINVLAVEAAARDFHARHHAKMRSYLYIVSRRRTAFGKRYVWWIKDKLDMQRMQTVIALFRGFHDFASFADKRRDKDVSTTVNLYAAELHESGDLLVFRIVGSHFLWKMVRRLVGITVEAGKGNLSAAEVKQMLTSFSELPAQLTAPGSGLFLEQVFYEGEKEFPQGLLPLPLLFSALIPSSLSPPRKHDH